jgi:hypothetical protein
VHERVELPEGKPLVTHHRRLTVRCPACGTRVVAPVPEVARGTPFGPRLHGSGHACMPSPLTLRRFRPCPTSGCKVPCPTCSGCLSARAV